MKTIPLSQNRFTIVDDDVFDELSKHKWFCAHGYAVRSDYTTGQAFQVRMHRVIMGVPEGLFIDHKNWNKLDNRRENLRICNRNQNGANLFVKRRNKSGFKGVSWKNSHSKWCAQIKTKHKVVYLGLFLKKEDAAAAYNEAATKIHGEFAFLNTV